MHQQHHALFRDLCGNPKVPPGVKVIGFHLGVLMILHVLTQKEVHTNAIELYGAASLNHVEPHSRNVSFAFRTQLSLPINLCAAHVDWTPHLPQQFPSRDLKPKVQHWLLGLGVGHIPSQVDGALSKNLTRFGAIQPTLSKILPATANSTMVPRSEFFQYQ
jgi:hypothetical protein